MYKTPQMARTTLRVNQATPGEPLEVKIEKLVNAKEPLEEGSVPLIYTPRIEGIRASTNIRTDRWEVAIEATEKIQKSYMARRQERLKKAQAEEIPGEVEAKAEAKTATATTSTP